jgi:hypothetical protein
MKVELVRLRLNSGGYTSDGSYYGAGAPLYQYRLELPDTYECFHRSDYCTDADVPRSKDGPYRCLSCSALVHRRINDVCEEIRAESREHAKEIIRRKYPDATFYR